MFADASVYSSVGIIIVQTDRRSWPFIVGLAQERERCRQIFEDFGAIHGLYYYLLSIHNLQPTVSVLKY
jgi:hypothetical protein